MRSLVLLVIAFLFGCGKAATPTSAIVVAKPNEVMITFFERHPVTDSFWVVNTPVSAIQDEYFLVQLGRRVREQTLRIKSALARYQGVNPLSRAIARMFAELKPMVYLRDGDIVQPGMTAQELQAPGFKLIYIPGDQIIKSEHPSPLYYNRQFGAGMIGAINWPDAILAGVVFHDFGHALRPALSSASAGASAESDLFIGEEVEMHELETLVFDAAISGGYVRWLDEVLSRNKEAKTPLDVFTPLAWRRGMPRISYSGAITLVGGWRVS